MKVWLDRLILFVEECQVRHQVLDDVCVWEWVYSRLVPGLLWNSACGFPVSRCSWLPNRFYGKSLQRQASVFTPSMFMAQLPQIPSRQLLRNVNVGSTSFLILIKASNIIGPVLLRSSVYDCIFGFSCGLSGDHR